MSEPLYAYLTCFEPTCGAMATHGKHCQAHADEYDLAWMEARKPLPVPSEGAQANAAYRFHADTLRPASSSSADLAALRREIEQRIVWLSEEAEIKRDLAEGWRTTDAPANKIAICASLLDCADAHDDQITLLRRCLAVVTAQEG